MLVGDFMIDDTNYADCLTLYNFNHVDKIKGKESFSYIFNDNINYIRSLYNRGKIRNITYDTIQKTILCGSIYLGYDLFVCPHCGNESIVPHKCHSKLCTSCGTKEAKLRAAHISSIALDAKHRHIVFTISKHLGGYFIKDRSLLNLLFIAARNTLACIFNDAKYRKIKKKKIYLKKNKCPYSYKNDRNKIVFGSVLTLHTFGRDLKWNPHIHCLISEGGYSDDGFWRNVKHFDYTFLRNAFRTALLNEMESKIGSSFKKVKAKCYREHQQGFYVYAKPNLCDPRIVVKYIGRYLGRPVIATSRIDKYDGEMVTFHYNRHEDEQYIEETIPAMEFIQRLIRHIPEKHFKMIRYGGIYARHREIDSKLYRAISKSKHHIYRSFNQWRTAILSSFGYDPLVCPDCQHRMEFLELYFNHQRVSLEEMYEKVMSKSRGKRSSA